MDIFFAIGFTLLITVLLFITIIAVIRHNNKLHLLKLNDEKQILENKVEKADFLLKEAMFQYIDRAEKQEVNIVSWFSRNIKEAKIKVERNDFYGDYYAISFDDVNIKLYQNDHSDCDGSIWVFGNLDQYLLTPVIENVRNDLRKIVDEEYNKRQEFERLSKLGVN